MAMSCEADASATASASAPTTQRCRAMTDACEQQPQPGEHDLHQRHPPRRRPQKGGTYRSIKGDQITLNATGVGPA